MASLVVAALAFAALAGAGAAWVHSASWSRALAVFLAFFPLGLWLSARKLSAVTGRIRRELGLTFLSPKVFIALGRTQALVVCKTGVLTQGRLRVVHFLNNVGEGREADALALAAAAERGIGNPVARAITAWAESKADRRLEPVSVRFEPGEGVEAEVEGRKVRLGTFSFVQRHGVDLRHMLRDPTNYPVSSRAYLVVGERLYGVFYLEDDPRSDLGPAVKALAGAGIATHLVSGDTEQAANFIATPLGLKSVHAGLSPEGKKKFVEGLVTGGMHPAVVGNGPSDAAMLGAASIALSDDASLAVNGVLAEPLSLDGVARGLLAACRAYRITLQNGAAAMVLHFAMGAAAWLGDATLYQVGVLNAALAAAVLVNWGRQGMVAVNGKSEVSRSDRESEHVVRVEIPIEGSELNDALCNAVASSLKSVPGVKDAEILREPPKALVRCDRRYATVMLLQNAIRATGLRVGAAKDQRRMGHYADIEEDFKVVS